VKSYLSDLSIQELVQATDEGSLSLIQGLIYGMRATTVIETGTHLGSGAMAIWESMLKVSSSVIAVPKPLLITIENDPVLQRRAMDRVYTSGLPDTDRIRFVLGDSTSFDYGTLLHGRLVDFAFIDCEYRFDAFCRVSAYGGPDTLVAVHDWVLWEDADEEDFRVPFLKAIHAGRIPHPVVVPTERTVALFRPLSGEE
jgi:predicted O-methyltransferase YrrM